MTMSNRELVEQVSHGAGDPNYIVGYLLATVLHIADRDTLDQTPAEYARWHLEHLALLGAESTAGETRDVPTPGAAG